MFYLSEVTKPDLSKQILLFLGYVSTRIRKYRSKLATTSDQRIKLISEIIGGIQVIKFYTWEKPFEKFVKQMRKSELYYIGRSWCHKCISLSGLMTLQQTSLCVMLTGYVLIGYQLTPDTVFLSAQLISILQTSIAIHLPACSLAFAELITSTGRIREFLLLNEIDTNEVISEAIGPQSIKLDDVSASWTTDKVTLKNITIQVMPEELCVLVGPVGSGKTSLLQVISSVV